MFIQLLDEALMTTLCNPDPDNLDHIFFCP
jgi:hypothetical protein